MPASALMLCGQCHLAWFPERPGAGAVACPACRAKGRRVPQLFHLGALVMAAGIGLGALQISRGTGPLPARLASSAGVTAAPAEAERPGQRGQARGARWVRLKERLVLEVAGGPKRGTTVTLPRGERLSVVKREGGKLLLQDRKGNRVYVKQDQVTTP